MSKIALDSLVAGGLALALLMVIGVDKLLTNPTAAVSPSSYRSGSAGCGNRLLRFSGVQRL